MAVWQKIREHFNWKHYSPQTYDTLRHGYSGRLFSQDLLAGVTVGIIALPLAMAFAIASGLPPAVGLYTAIIAGFLTAFLGGSPVQIGGPTGAFVVIVYKVVQTHGFEGLAIATLIAGILLILMGLARFGILLRFVSYPVLRGFTTGIAVLIVVSQVKDFFGLAIDKVPGDFIPKWQSYISHFHTWNPIVVALAVGSLLLILLIRRWKPNAPSYLFVVVGASFVVWYFNLPVATIGSTFGSVPNSLPMPSWPEMTLDKVVQVMPDAVTIALLAAIESLLCAMVADGMLGTVHKPDCELVAQGVSNMGSVVFGGIPATGAIARTAANIRMGAKTPVAGMTHAVTLVILMWLFAPFAEMIPLAALAAILIVVAWQMAEMHHLKDDFKAPWAEIAVMVITFAMTILVDLTEAVKVGVILSAFIFLKHMMDRTTLSAVKLAMEQSDPQVSLLDDPEATYKKHVPKEVAVFEFNGPLFFGVTELFQAGIDQIDPYHHKAVILRMRHVPMIDGTGVRALRDFKTRCDKNNVRVVLSGVSEEFLQRHQSVELERAMGRNNIFPNFDSALAAVAPK